MCGGMYTMGNLSKLAPECELCEHRDSCDTKRMVACAYLNKPQYLEQATADIVNPLTQDILVKHEYRDVWIDENTTVTIDLEDIKKQLVKDFYKKLTSQFGA